MHHADFDAHSLEFENLVSDLCFGGGADYDQPYRNLRTGQRDRKLHEPQVAFIQVKNRRKRFRMIFGRREAPYGRMIRPGGLAAQSYCLIDRERCRILVRLQQDLGRRSGGVLEGRDIGTKVFPDTPYKFFLTARPEVRARRRHAELLAKGEGASYETILAGTLARDEQDSTRSDSPLTYDDTYIVIDTSDLTIDEVVQRIVRLSS